MNPKIKKAGLLILRRISYPHFTKLFYWSDRKLYDLGNLFIMPAWWYIGIFKSCMWLLKFKAAHHAAEVCIHHVPMHIRFRAS